MIDADELKNDFDIQHFINNERVFDIPQIKAFIDIAPTVEAKPVVHCKDCEHWGTGVAGETEHVKCCEYGKYMVGENGFCCYADMRKKVE